MILQRTIEKKIAGYYGFEYKDGETGSMPEDSENSKEIVDGEIVDTNVGTNK
jgi:hypothetical protein